MRALPLDDGAERTKQILERCAGGILSPLVEVGRLDRAYVDRQAGVFESHGNQDAALGRIARLAANPAGGHGCRGPDHQHGIGRLQLRVDLVVELLAGINRRIPPDRPALRLDRGHERRDARLVAAGVGNEHVGHA